MSSELTGILFREYRSLLLLHPDQAYHVREIVRLTNTLPGTLPRELSRLARAGVLTRCRQGNQISYQANPDCVVYAELASIMRKTSGMADVLREHLLPVSARISLAAVFGSVPGGRAREGSDIDLLLIGEPGFGEAVRLLQPAEEILGREINPQIYAAREWKAAREKGSAFIQDILASPLIYVQGGPDDLG